MPRSKPKRRIHTEPSTQQAPYSPPQSVDLPPKTPYPQQEPGQIQYIPEHPRIVLVETRTIWSDGSVYNEVRTHSDNAFRR